MTAKKADANKEISIEERAEINLKIWNTVMHTAPSATKAFKRRGGFKGTAIKPMWTIQKATEFFGPVGIGWGYDVLEDRELHAQDGNAAWFSKVQVWFMWEGERRLTPPQWGGTYVIEAKPAREWDDATQKYKPVQGGGMVYEIDDEAPKKSVTDGMTKCLSYLGFAADVHLGMYDDSKYVNDMKREESQQTRGNPPEKLNREPTGDEKWRDEMVKMIKGIIDPKELQALWKEKIQPRFPDLRKSQEGSAIAAFVKHTVEDQKLKIAGKPPLDDPRRHEEQQHDDDGGMQDRRDQRGIMEK